MIRYTYDRQGNMLSEKSMKSGEEKKYSYDSFGRMVRAEVPVEHRGASNKPDKHAGFSNAAQSAGETFGTPENSSATREFQVQINRYDGEGLRHEMEENGRLIKFLYNEDREVVAEETSNGRTITRYIRGLGIISSDSEEAKTYYHYVSDEQRSITHVLSEDAEILNNYSYDAFGNIIQKTEKVENRFCYNGEMLDPVTQQYYLRARFYNPVIGRFTQEDTYYGDGLNLYQYCQANPLGYVDSSGHNICPTQLSLYKKYKEFLAKKMPEAEAKKKAYEYMRKKMGLTADNPFTEASEGGTKSAYNDSGVGKSKNSWISYETSYGKSSEKLNWDAIGSKKGETRVEHIKRHTVQNNSRETHSVFNGNPIDMVNDAWEQRHLVEPISDGMGGTIYNIPYKNAGYESGYINTGAQMDYITIVTLDESTDLITAFPSFGDYHKDRRNLKCIILVTVRYVSKAYLKLQKIN